jgi:class 3 adenylate cyclase
LTSTLGDEATHKLVQRVYERCTGIVRSFSGTVERHIGDAIMAVFGLPFAHGNDPERALRAALAIHEAMPRLRRWDTLEACRHRQWSGRGQPCGRGRRFSTVGDAVNLGARLAAMAQLGTALGRFSGRSMTSAPLSRSAR